MIALLSSQMSRETRNISIKFPIYIRRSGKGLYGKATRRKRAAQRNIESNGLRRERGPFPFSRSFRDTTFALDARTIRAGKVKYPAVRLTAVENRISNTSPRAVSMTESTAARASTLRFSYCPRPVSSPLRMGFG